MNRRDRRVPFLILLLCSLLVSCAAAGDPTFTVAARDYQSAVGPEYLRYVDADAALLEADKKLRHATVARFEEAIVSREALQVRR